MARVVLEKLVTISSDIYSAHDRASLFEALDKAAKSLGFDTFILSSNQTVKRDTVANPIMTNFPASFLADYDHFNWFDDDMNLARVLETDRAFYADSREARFSEARKQSYIDFLQASRMSTGILVPLGPRPASTDFFSLVSFDGQPARNDVLHASIVMANASLAKAEMLGLSTKISADEAIAIRTLSSVQRSILHWVAEGKSNLDVATILGIPERTVRYHVGEILRKLSVATRMQAASICRAAKRL